MTVFLGASEAEAINAAASVTDPEPPKEPAAAYVCPECGDGFKEARNLGSHRKFKHGVAGTNTHKKGTTRARAREAKPRPVVEGIRQFGQDAGAGRSSAPPTENDLTKAFGRALGTVSYAAAAYAVESDPRLTTDEMKEATIDYLALEPNAARDLAQPIGRAFHRSPLNKRYGRPVVDNVDLVASVAELVTLSMHWRRYMSDLHAWRRSVQAQGALPMSPYAAPIDENPPMLGPSAAMQNGQPTGRVWTAEDVERARMQS